MAYARPVQFEEAWRHVMSNPISRAWAFDSRPPTAKELIRGGQNNPFIISFLTDTSDEQAFSHQQYRSRLGDLYCCVKSLRDGTRLGIVLNSAGCDFWVPVFSSFEESFRVPAQAVNRLVITSVCGRLVIMHFAWLVSGAFSVRFFPFASLGNQPKTNVRVDAFSKSDADLLTAIAFSERPSLDFLNANFEGLMLSRPRYTLKTYDTTFQFSCMFCSTQGILECACPMPMKRRSAGPNAVFGHGVSSILTIWDACTHALKATEPRGTAIYNVFSNSNDEHDKVLAGGFMPFHMGLCWEVVGDPTLHQYLASTGTTLFEPTRMIITDSSTALNNTGLGFSINSNSNTASHEDSSSYSGTVTATFNSSDDMHDDCVSSMVIEVPVERSTGFGAGSNARNANDLRIDGQISDLNQIQTIIFPVRRVLSNDAARVS